MIEIIWNRYLTNRRRYEKGEYKPVESCPVPHKFVKLCERVSSEIQKHKAKVDDWIDAQFYYFFLTFDKPPFITQLCSGKSYERYVLYMKEGRERCIEMVARDVSFTSDQRISWGKDLLRRLKTMHPQLSRNAIVKTFADQFPEEFLLWYANRNNSVESQVRRVLSLR